MNFEPWSATDYKVGSDKGSDRFQLQSNGSSRLRLGPVLRALIVYALLVFTRNDFFNFVHADLLHDCSFLQFYSVEPLSPRVHALNIIRLK